MEAHNGAVLAIAADAIEGDLLRLEFDVDRGECAAFRISLDALGELGADEAIRTLTGIEEFGADITSAVARSVGINSTQLVEVLRKRGDDRVADLLPAPQLDDALQDALSELADVLGDDQI